MALGSSTFRGLTLVTGLALAIAPTLAAAHDRDRGGVWRDGSWYDEAPADLPPPAYSDGYAPPPYPAAGPRGPAPQFDPAARDAWLADCRHRIARRDDGVGGAVIGGVVGGVAGNRIAGRNNRTVGTIAGAAVGAVAGSAIDRAEDRGRDDECAAYLDDYYAQYQRSYAAGYYPGYANYGGYPVAYAPGYASPGGCCVTAAPMMMVPVVQPAPQCTETVEYVYEDVPVRRRAYTPVKRTKIVPDKRVKIVPDKRVRTK